MVLLGWLASKKIMSLYSINIVITSYLLYVDTPGRVARGVAIPFNVQILTKFTHHICF